MSTTIDAVALVSPHHRLRAGALHLAVQATRRALKEVGEVPGEVDLLINSGLYRDRNLGEPAFASVIQDDVGANPDDPHPGGTGTFSFDLANGTCGPLSALQVADGFLRAGTVTTVVITASDADPGHGLAPNFPFRPAGGALVCHCSDAARGLGPFRWRTTPDGGRSLRATIDFERGTNLLAVSEEDGYPNLAGHLAAGVAHDLLHDVSLDADAVDLVIAAPARPMYTEVLGAELGIPADRIVTSGPGLHTVAFIGALEKARSDGRLRPGTTVLFACAAAGLTAGAAIYRA